jgi:hypothetical protein
MAPKFILTVLLVSLPALVASPAQAEPKRQLMAQRPRVAAATVTLPELSCAGVVAGARTQVLTAAHCVAVGATEVEVALHGGDVKKAWVAYIDRSADLALLRLDEDVAVEPLRISDELASRGKRLLFVGRVDRPSRTQVVQVQRLGRCPTLPDVDQALFTSVVARPGDSGAPLVDDAGRVVGLVHGGSRCHIAAPTAELTKLWPDYTAGQAGDPLAAPKKLLRKRNPTPGSAPDPARTPRAPADTGNTDTDSADSFVWENTPDGFRVRFKFTWDWKTPESP